VSGGWFFVVASEAIYVGDIQIALPGVGSYVARAIQQSDLAAVGWAIAAMTIAIMLYDQLLFRPMVVWADKFRFEQTASQIVSNAASWLPPARAIDAVWWGFIAAGIGYVGWELVRFAQSTLSWADVRVAAGNGALTLLRVIILIALASAIWVSIGVAVGLRPKLTEKVQPVAQFLAAFPANLLFPLAVFVIVRFGLAPRIWLSPLMILGTQWYILFNVIAGASAFPSDFREAAASFRVRPWRWWRQILLPGIFPYYITGAITASGGAWNASIVSEAVSWGSTKLSASGLGAYIAQMTEGGDYPRIALGIAVMSLLVIAMNRLLWWPLYAFAEHRTRLD
jgi:NitT/TauT family transport system permease protein